MIPAPYVSKISEVHGQAGVDWLNRLPSILDQCCQTWLLELKQPYPNLSYNYVVPGIRTDGLQVVIKAGVLKNGSPDKELITEHDALRHFDGDGMVNLLDANLSLGVLVLERLIPGHSLRNVDVGDRAPLIAARVMNQLWKEPPSIHGFPNLADWAVGLNRLKNRFGGGYGPFPGRLVDGAEEIFSELLHSSTSQVLLHGDLHHDNILQGQRNLWLGIDPKGVIGDPTYEVGAFLRNISCQGDEEDLLRLLRRTIDQFCEYLELDRQRIIKWGFAQSVLSAWWSYEDNERLWAPGLAWAERFERIEKI